MSQITSEFLSVKKLKISKPYNDEIVSVTLQFIVCRWIVNEVIQDKHKRYGTNYCGNSLNLPRNLHYYFLILIH